MGIFSKKKIKKVVGDEFYNFIAHFSNYAIADFFVSGLSLLGIPIFTRLLSPEGYGQLSLFVSLVTLLTVITTISSKASLIRYYNHYPNSFYNYQGNSTLYLLIQGFVILSFSIIFIDELSLVFNIEKQIFFFAILVSLIAIPETIYTSFLQASQNSRSYSRIMILMNFIIFILSILWVYLLENNKYFGRIYSRTLIGSLFFLFFLLKIIQASKFKLRISMIKYLIIYSLPLIPHAISGTVLVYFDRIIINQLEGIQKTGLYSLAYNVGMVMNIVVLSLNRTWTPVFYKRLSEDNHSSINLLVTKNNKIIVLIGAFFTLFSMEAVKLLADKSFYESTRLVPIIIASYYCVFAYTIYANYAFYRKRVWLISLFTMIATTLNIFLNYWFIPLFGYEAAAYTTLISYLILFILHFLNVKFIMKEKSLPNLKGLIGGLLIFFILIFFNAIVKIDNYFISILLRVGLIFLLVIFIFRSSMKAILKKVKS